mmetsp:Transcript_7024/g.10287  ORF Transcript_7024/g.10287 Transcript_7024/m.10287 type:complete len:223 (-) Transcript_7024:3244-3912(-)
MDDPPLSMPNNTSKLLNLTGNDDDLGEPTLALSHTNFSTLMIRAFIRLMYDSRLLILWNRTELGGFVSRAFSSPLNLSASDLVDASTSVCSSARPSSLAMRMTIFSSRPDILAGKDLSFCSKSNSSSSIRNFSDKLLSVSFFTFVLSLTPHSSALIRKINSSISASISDILVMMTKQESTFSLVSSFSVRLRPCLKLRTFDTKVLPIVVSRPTSFPRLISLS